MSAFLKTQPTAETLNGILLVDKPFMYTSHDVVDAVRRILGMKRVGHAGTLDPMATGLLVMLLGEATSSFDALANHDKEYQGIMSLGMVTDTQDLEGRILSTKTAEAVSLEQVESVFRRFTGQMEQKVPRYSSAKIKGVASHRLARKNIAFAQPVKSIEVKRLELLGYDNPDIHFRLLATKGTYVRTLCEDIGQILGVGAVLSGLRRIRSGSLDVSQSVTLEKLAVLSRDELKSRLVQP